MEWESEVALPGGAGTVTLSAGGRVLNVSTVGGGRKLRWKGPAFSQRQFIELAQKEGLNVNDKSVVTWWKFERPRKGTNEDGTAVVSSVCSFAVAGLPVLCAGG